MKHFVFQILDVASALGKAAASAHPAGALAHLGEPHHDRTTSHQRPSQRTRTRRPSTTAAQPAAPAPAPAPPAEPVPGRPATAARVMGTGRWTAGFAVTAAAVLVAMTLAVPPASAREALPAVSTPAAAFGFAPRYAEPLSQLGERTLAQYLADHQAHVLGLVRG